LKKLFCKNLNLFYFTMWFLIIVQIILGYTVARCPRSESAMRLYCIKRWERCSYKKCYCYGKYQKKTSYYCAPWKRWKRVGIKTKCPPCPKKCGCTSKKVPVCATNGRTYTNKCQLSCNKKRIACNGKCPCKNDCRAKCKRLGTFRYCGKDGKTYRNKCRLRCANVKYKCLGKCPCRGHRKIKFRPIKFRPYRPRRSLRRYRPRRSFRSYRRSFRSFRG